MQDGGIHHRCRRLHCGGQCERVEGVIEVREWRWSAGGRHESVVIGWWLSAGVGWFACVSSLVEVVVIVTLMVVVVVVAMVVVFVVL